MLDLYRSRLLRLLLVSLFAVSSAEAVAQDDPPQITLDDLFLSSKFATRGFASGKWAPQGPIVTYAQPTGDGETSIVSYDLESDSTTLIVDGSMLMADDVGRLIEVEGYQFSADGTKALLYTDSERVWRLNTKGYYYVYDLETGDLSPVADRELGFQMFAKFDPAGEHVGFVRGRNIFVVDLNTGEERRLTRDGSAGGIINGTSDWVYEEEFGLRNAWHWSPDGRHIAFLQLDETRTRDYWLADLRGQYPEFQRFRYPKAGETNSEIQAGVIDVASGEITFFDTETWFAGGEEFEYLPQIGWTPLIDGQHHVWTFRLNRDQNNLDLIYGNPSDGTTRIILNETERTYIDVETGFSDLDVGKLTYLKDGEHFVWISEGDGHKHLYLYTNGGELVSQITSGEWQVSDFEGVDEDAGLVYFTGTIEHSTQRHLYRATFSTDGQQGGAPERITQGDGWHSSNLSADKKYFIDSYSALNRPLTVKLHSADGQELKVLENNDELRATLAEYGRPDVEMIEVAGANGTPLNAYIVRPTSFSPFRQYPLLIFGYGGPGSQRVRDAWPGRNGFWHQYLADNHDVVVVTVDPRGTGGRGKEFQSVTYRQLGVVEAQDFQAVARNLGDLDYIDASRIGMWGWSYGGFMVLNSMLMEDGPEIFRLGVAVAPVVDWRQYDTIYTERYMSTPQNNEEGYSLGSPINYADRMSDEQKLLIIHGTGDDNVHLQNSIQMVEALQLAGKQFEFMVYPHKTHSISGASTQHHLFTLITNFIAENL